jgi:hypothetical protein
MFYLQKRNICIKNLTSKKIWSQIIVKWKSKIDLINMKKYTLKIEI